MSAKKLSGHKVLTFDCYGTIIDWESGAVAAMQPLLDSSTSSSSPPTFTRQQLLSAMHECEAAQQALTPDLPYDQILAAIYPQIAAKLGLPTAPTPDQSAAFGASIGSWPAFPDSVDALRRLGKRFKLVILSNVDRESFKRTNEGPLEGVPFDLILTAQDIGSYKPDLKNFEYMLGRVKEEFGAEKDDVVQTAQSQFHDHHPAKKIGMRSSYIVRPGAVMGVRETEVWDWKFDTLGEMAGAVEKEAEAA